jgi:hypothetical protein
MRSGLAVLAILATVVAAVSAGAAEVMIDNRFIDDKSSDCGVRGWKYNPVESYKPYGEVAGVVRDGVAGVSIRSTGRITTIVLQEHLHVKPGERYRMSAEVRGKGRFSMAVFQAEFPWKWRGVQGDNQHLKAEPQMMEQLVTVPEKVERMYPAISVTAGSDVELMNFRLEKLDD